jgi:O-antigen ligase
MNAVALAAFARDTARGEARLLGAAAGIGAATAFAFAWAGASGVGALAVGVLAALATVAAARPFAGFVALISAATLADQHLRHFFPWTHDLGFFVFENLWKVLSPTGERRFTPLVFNAVEVVILAVAAGAIGSRSRRAPRSAVSRELPFAGLYLGAIAIMFAAGLAAGGELKPALWQVRGPVHFVAFALLAPMVIRTERQLGVALGALLGAALFKALQVDWIFFVEERARFGAWREVLGHEDSMFFAVVLTITATLALERSAFGARRALLLASPFVLMALLVNQRRASYVALALGLLLVPVLLPERRRAWLRGAAVLAVAAAAYAALFWGLPDHPLGRPLQKARSIVAAAPSSDDASSNLYRSAESINLERTLAEHPLGLGFGHPYELHVPVVDIGDVFPQWRYNPHDTILGMWIALGTPGFVAFLLWLGALLLGASRELKEERDPSRRAAAFAVVSALAAGLIVATVDHYLGTERGAVFLGTLAGLPAVLRRLRAADPNAAPSDA